MLARGGRCDGHLRQSEHRGTRAPDRSATRRERKLNMVEQQLSKSAQAARLLLAVRRGAPRLEALPPALAPQDLAGAYAIQLALLEQLDSGIAGWKASLFSAEDGACAPLPANAVVDAPAYAQVLHPPLLDPPPHGIEAEVAFRIGRDLPPLPAG